MKKNCILVGAVLAAGWAFALEPFPEVSRPWAVAGSRVAVL